MTPAGENVFNYAIARVRFWRPGGIDAIDVRVFFRHVDNRMDRPGVNANGSYRRRATGSARRRCWGCTGGEINNVPCFAEPRDADMELQTDTPNRRTLQGTGPKEVFAYFGCWLDFNQNVKRFP